MFLANGGALKDWQQSQTDLATAQNNRRSAEVALAAVRNRLRILGKSDAEIAALEAGTGQMQATSYVVSPVRGVVTQRQVGLGQNIQSLSAGASNPVYTIGDPSTVWMIANVRETDASLMRVGIPVSVSVPAFPDRVFSARLSWVAASIDANTHRLPVRAEVDNGDGALKPMMFARFRIVVGDPQPAPAVPAKAVLYEGETARVWVAGDDGTLALREIRTGQTSDGMVEVAAGLSPGETVVTSGALFIDQAAQGE